MWPKNKAAPVQKLLYAIGNAIMLVDQTLICLNFNLYSFHRLDKHDNEFLFDSLVRFGPCEESISECAVIVYGHELRDTRPQHRNT